MSESTKSKLARMLKQPSTLQGLNVLGTLAAYKMGIAPDTVLAVGGIVAGAILVGQDEDKKPRKRASKPSAED